MYQLTKHKTMSECQTDPNTDIQLVEKLMKNIHDSNEPPDFSIVLGGPLFQLLMRLRLTTPALDLLKKRIFCITLFAWLPLLLLSLIEGKAWGNVGVPFLYDMEVQTRFLVALPLLIGAEYLVHKQLRLLVGQFIDREIITEKVLPSFKELVASAMKLRNSVTAELILLLLVFVGGHRLWSTVSIMETSASGSGSWYASFNSADTHLSLTGYWYIFVSRPLFQFIAYRWYFRIFIWARFLWQSSRLDLNLIPTHPDRACGLGFLGMSSILFAPLIMAHGALFAGLIANSIFFAGAKLTDFMTLILGVVLFVQAIVLGPLFVFLPSLMRAKRTGLRDYGVLASNYVGEFDFKWVRGGASNERLIGSGDIQSLADLANSFQVIRDVRSYPFEKDTAIQVLLFVLVPILPLVLTMIPLNELIKKIINTVF